MARLRVCAGAMRRAWGMIKIRIIVRAGCSVRVRFRDKSWVLVRLMGRKLRPKVIVVRDSTDSLCLARIWSDGIWALTEPLVNIQWLLSEVYGVAFP